MRFDGYDTEGFFDEMIMANGQPRPAAALLKSRIESLSDGDLERRQVAAEAIFMNRGVTFNVYSNAENKERIFPFDIVPRIIDAAEWERLERGLTQRVQALNCFIDDVYHDQKILKDKIIPADLVTKAKAFRAPCVGLNPARSIWCHITGTDLVRDQHGQMYVLEDNLRCPSGVSYVLENRMVMKRTFPEIFDSYRTRPIVDYPSRLLQMLRYLASDGVDDPTVAVLTLGMYNSAYFEHSFLAQQMGVELVEGSDLVVDNGYVKMRTTKGLERIDVLYRRVDDDFIDPQVFRSDSMLGIPGLMEAYRHGRVALANAPGTGIADDKAVYAYVPQMVRYYLDQDIIIPNVPTYVCRESDKLQYVLEHLDDMVVKPVNESGGYGMLVGPHATADERAQFRERVKADPRNYIAQPTLSLSRAPVIVDNGFEGRHVDLRPFILFGKDIYVLPGGLTRVALTKGSLVVNSSQGGGSKDTWVVAEANES